MWVQGIWCMIGTVRSAPRRPWLIEGKTDCEQTSQAYGLGTDSRQLGWHPSVPLLRQGSSK